MLRNVLSLFDGISCGRLALDRARIRYEKYYASEIDKYAIAIARYNYSDTIFVGDVRYLKGKDFKGVDLIIGGSPCQNFSFSGKRRGMITNERIEITLLEQYLRLKEQEFEFEGQSYLFWEFARLLKEIKPKWFLLENVRMPKKWKDVITNVLEVEPIEINSALVSAQNRRRLYWTNIPIEGFPEDKGLVLKDILEDEVDKKYFINKRLLNMKGGLFKESATNLCIKVAELDIKGQDNIKRVYSVYGKSPTLTTMQGGYRQPKIIENTETDKIKVRKIIPLECERLQTLPDNYTKYGLFENGKVKQISDTQRYKVIGNAFTVDVITWIFSFIKKEL